MKHNQATKTKNRTIKTPTHKYVDVIILNIGAVFCMVAPLVHIDMPVESPSVSNFKKHLVLEEKALEQRISDLRKEYENDQVGAADYIVKNDNLTAELSAAKSSNKKELSQYIDNQRLFGWKSPRKFWIAFGIRIPYLLFAIVFALVVKLWNPLDSLLKRALILAQVVFFAHAFYHVGWVFWALGTDYPPKTYYVFYVALTLLIGIACTYSVQWYKNNIDILKSKIRYVMNLMVIKAIDTDQVKDVKDYTEEIISPAIDKLSE